MKFKCKQITIDDEEFGCTVAFYEKKDKYKYEGKISIDKIMASQGQYISLQRTYSEDDFEDDFCSIEMSDFDKSGELRHFNMELYRDRVLIGYKDEIIDINININELQFDKLKKALKKIAYKNGQFRINE